MKKINLATDKSIKGTCAECVFEIGDPRHAGYIREKRNNIGTR